MNLDTNDNIIEKFKYIGLDLDNIPERIKNFSDLNYRPTRYNDEHVYKMYRYIDVNDIEILLTPTNRLSNISDKYGKAVPLYAYLNSEIEENIERHTKFLSMTSQMNIDRIEEIEKEQEILNKNIPFMVKFPKDYLWQIYYSEFTNKYFMLVPTEDLDYSAFFYLLKKQLQNKEGQKVFVPISYIDYTGEYLSRSQVSEIENYLWLFTKDWPLVYEVYDKDENLSLQITGKAYIYDDIQSEYRIKLDNKEDAIKLYKLLKALFILKTEVSHKYNIELSIDDKGSLEYSINNKKVIYEILSSIVKEEYLKAEELKINITEDRAKKEKELDKLQKKATKLEKEYLEKERQISTFLECKKTFFGRVKYFIKYKKVNLSKHRESKEKEQDVKIIRVNKYSEVKSNYTLEELITLQKQIDKEDMKLKNLNSDIKAIKQRIKNLENKVKNATKYIQEIDNHKKSIFDFWRFTNKDKAQELPEGEKKEESTKRIKKVFDYQLDFDDLAKQLDEYQRENLTREELNSIYLASTYILKDINIVKNKEKINEEDFEITKERIMSQNLLLEKDNFDIFAGMAYDNKLKILANQKHREEERQIYKILDINKNTKLNEYVEKLENVISNLNSAFEKIKLTVDLPVYKAITGKMNDKINVFNIEGKNTVSDLIKENTDRFNVYKINLKENIPILPFTNIVYYENNNKTLPLGMNISEGILLNNDLLDLELKSSKTVKIVSYKDPDNHLSSVKIKEIDIEQYDIKEKSSKEEKSTDNKNDNEKVKKGKE